MNIMGSTRRIGDLLADGSISAIQDGNHGGSHPKASEYVQRGVPFVMASDVRDGQLLLAQAKRLPKARTDALRIGFARTGDVLLTHKGTVGEVAIVPAVDDYVMLTPQVTYYRVNEAKLSARYLALAFRSPHFQGQLANVSAQSTRPYIAISTQRHLTIPWREVDEQSRVASILGAYDDLIEVNRRRIAVLEEMARRLFEEWFVSGRTPIRLRGEAPVSDWPRAKVGDAMQFVRGRSYRSADLADSGGLPFVNLKCMLRDGGFRRDGVKRYVGEFKEEQLLHRGDIVVAVTDMTQERRIVGQAARIPRSDEPLAVMSMDLVKVRPGKGLDPDFCYYWLRYSGFANTAAQHANGANVLHLSPSAIVGLPMTLPPLDIQDAFGRIVAPLAEQAEVMSMANERLAASRDLLLPRLISGDLEVKTAERELEGVA